MRMDLAGDTLRVEEGYEVKLPPGNHLIVVAGAHFGEPGYDFDHPHVAAKKSELAEFKHYRGNGNKFWTSKAGIRFYFVLPKAQVELLPEKGYSYVPMLIGGRKCHLNVCGGTTSAGWRDCVDRVAHIGCGWPVKGLQSLADIAVSPTECQAQGITLEIKLLDDSDRQGFIQAAAAVTMRNSLGPGSQVLLRDGYSCQGSRGPFVVESRPHRQRHFICAVVMGRARVSYAAIDWVKTAVTVHGVSTCNCHRRNTVFQARLAQDFSRTVIRRRCGNSVGLVWSAEDKYLLAS